MFYCHHHKTDTKENTNQNNLKSFLPEIQFYPQSIQKLHIPHSILSGSLLGMWNQESTAQLRAPYVTPSACACYAGYSPTTGNIFIISHDS